MHRLFCAKLVLLALIAIALPGCARAARLDLSAGRLHFQLREDRNVFLAVDGVPVIYESTLYLMPPGWNGQPLLNQDDAIPVVASSTEGNAKVGTATYETPDASARYRFEVRPDNTFRVSLTYAGKGKPGIVQYWAGLLNANLLAGAHYTAETVDGSREGTVPLAATTADQTASKLTPSVKRIAFSTVLGRIEIAVEGSDPANQSLTLFDARLGTAGWAKKNPTFWLGVGVPDPDLTPGEHTVTVTYRFSGLTTPNVTIPSAEGSARVSAIPDAVVPFAREMPIIPRPKEVIEPDAPVVRVTSATQIVIPDSPTDEEKQAARELQSELLGTWSVRVPIKRAADSHATSRKATRLVLTRPAAIGQWFGQVEDVNKPEGYVLKSGGSLAVVGGADARGVYYGAQTLKQLIRVDGQGVYVKSVAIRDWPSLSFRGVHWFGGPKSWPFHERMISRIIAPLKMNAMVYQADYTQWDSQPKVWSPERSTPKDQVRKTVSYARQHFLEPIPMVNGMGHAEWLFQNGQNLDIAADPANPYAYNPENPRTYDVLFPILQEAIDLFHPKYFHLGNDEVTMRGKFPPEGVDKTVTQLLIEDTTRRHDWLKAKGIQTMMWGDTLLHRTEASDAGLAPTKEDAAQRRAALPKDIVIADWHYQGASPDFPSVDVLQKEGFKVVGTTWYDWGNIEKFARVLEERDAKGFLQSTWAGYAMSLDVLKGSEFRQFVAYLLGAEYAWNGGGPTIAELGYSPDDAFLTLWNHKPVRMGKRPGFTVDLSGLSNNAMWDWERITLSAFQAKAGREGGGNTGGAFPKGIAQLGGVTFRTGSPVWLAGALNPAGVWPKAVTIDLGGKTASDLYLLWGATHAAPLGTPVATVKVTYTDGTASQMAASYGQEVFAFTDLRSGPSAFIAWRGESPGGQAAAARRTVWENPHPQKPIRSVTITSTVSQAAPILLGLTGVTR